MSDSLTTVPLEAVQENEKTMSIEALISQAITKKVPVDTMEKLLAMRRELKAERSKEMYDMAMAAFQAECPEIAKTKEVKTSSGVVAYRYAPIESIVEQVKAIIQKHGFSYSTGMKLLDNGATVCVTVKVTHRAGHSEVTEMTVPLGGKTAIMSDTQRVAAAQTFAKRYAFCNAFGILTGDEDDDAVSTKALPDQTQRRTSQDVRHVGPNPSASEPMTDVQRGNILQLLTDTNRSVDELNEFTKKSYNKLFGELTFNEAAYVMRRLEVERKNKRIATANDALNQYHDENFKNGSRCVYLKDGGKTCGLAISEKVKNYSQEKYGKHLCVVHQKVSTSTSEAQNAEYVDPDEVAQGIEQQKSTASSDSS